MQNVHELSQPIWIVTHAECGWSRRAGSADGYASCSSRISTTGALEPGAVEQRRRACARLWVPNTTSTWPARCDDQLAVLLGEAAADRDLEPGPRGLQRLEAAEVPVELVVGVLPDAARVEHDDVGGVEVVGGLHARRPRAGPRCAPSRARSSGTRRCARRSGAERRPSRAVSRPISVRAATARALGTRSRLARLASASRSPSLRHVDVTVAALRSWRRGIVIFGSHRAGHDRLRVEPARGAVHRARHPRGAPGDPGARRRGRSAA